MGACEVGQIKELCDFVHPKYGILTRIGVAHLDSFKTEENIQKTKFELIESLPSDGIGILNMDDPKQVSYDFKGKCKIKWIGIENKDADLVASNIKGTYSGMSFDVQFKGEKKKYKLETKLLGNANVYNILAATLLARELGMSMDEITLGVKSIRTIEHRLEMKKVGHLNVIDDAYNSNPIGSKMALDTLALMPGVKVIITPGMIELKDKEYDLNFEFGRQIAKVCDYVILVGKSQTKAIYDGLLEEKYPKDKIDVFDDVFQAFNVVRSMGDGTYVLLENDLPDLFNE
jgi:UDP-N-acetylmuramoyl-tripeptide--D-alanyl-D-alanine ligase